MCRCHVVLAAILVISCCDARLLISGERVTLTGGLVAAGSTGPVEIDATELRAENVTFVWTGLAEEDGPLITFTDRLRAARFASCAFVGSPGAALNLPRLERVSVVGNAFVRCAVAISAECANENSCEVVGNDAVGGGVGLHVRHV